MAKTKAEPNKDIIDTLIERITKTHGEGSIQRVSKLKGLRLTKFSTGVTALDLALLGGFAEGRIHEIVGPYSATKTTTFVKAAAEYLKKYPKGVVVIVDAENAFDTEWLYFLVGDEIGERMLLCRPLDGEDAAQTAIDIVDIINSSRAKCLIGVDSIASLIPTAEVEGDMDKSSVGALPRLVTKFCRKLVALMRSDLENETPRCTVIFLNQVRMKIGLLFGNPETSPGGEGKKHFVSTQIILHNAGFINEVHGDQKEAVGMHVSYDIPKNKCQGPQKVAGKFIFYNRGYNGNPGGTFNNEECLLNHCLAYHYAKHAPLKNAKRRILVFGQEFSSPKAFIAEMREDPELFKEYCAAAIKKAKDRFWRRYAEENKEVDEPAKGKVKGRGKGKGKRAVAQARKANR